MTAPETPETPGRRDGPSEAAQAHAPWRADAARLGLAQAAIYALPLVTVPLLAHRLGAAAYGDAIAALAWGQLVATLPAFGFATTAPRTLVTLASPIARRREVSAIVGARLALTLAGVALVAATAPLLPARVGALWPAVAMYVAGQGLAWGWAFDGAGRFGTSALLAALSRVPVPLGLWLAVHRPTDAGRVLLVYGAASLLETTIGAVLAARAGWLGRVGPRDVGRALRGGAAIFGGQALVTAYVAATGLWLRMAGLPAADVGRYVAGEQVARAATSFLQPLTRVFVPRLASVQGRGRLLWARRSLQATLAVGAVLMGVLAVGAGLLPWVLGADLADASSTVARLAPLPLIVAASQAAGLQPFVADRRDGAVVAMFATGALVTVAGAFLVAPRAGVAGMAASLLAAELAVLGVALVLRRRLATR